MKCYLFALAILFLSCSKSIYKSDAAIAAETGGRIELSAGADRLKTSWNSMLQAQKLEVSLRTIEIKEDFDSINKRSYRYAFAFSDNDSVKVAHLLVSKKGKLYLDKKVVPLTIICHGCTASQPKFSFDKWGWSCETHNLTDCKKIIIVNTL